MRETIWPHSITIKSGETVTIRPIQKNDFAKEARFINQLSEESKYFRFMKVVHKVSDETVRKFTEIDYDDQMALIAIADDAIDLKKRTFWAKPRELKSPESSGLAEVEIGVARFVRIKGKQCCEFAIVVADAWQGCGIGSRLMLELIAFAREKRLICMCGDIFSVNTKMIQFVKGLGFDIIPCVDDARFVQAVLKFENWE
jgi:acetyltransferase